MRTLKILFLLIILCWIFMQFGCSLLENENPTKQAQKNQSSQNQTKDGSRNIDKAPVEQAEQRLQDAKENLTRLKDPKNPEKINADSAKELCEKMTRQSIAAKNPKYKDPESNTGIQCSKADQMEETYNNKIKSANEEINKLSEDLQKLKSPQPSPASDADSGTSNTSASIFPDWLLPLVAGVISLAIVGSILFFIFKLSKNFKAEKSATENGFKKLTSKQGNLQQDIDDLKKQAVLLSKQMSEQRAEISALKSQNRRTESSVETYAQPIASFPPPAPKFPVSVDNYLARNSNDLAFGKIDPLFGTLKENREDGAFYLARDGATNEDERCAVPRSKQFVTKDDYVYHYSNYYECANPGGGEVWIRKPAVVGNTPDGWKLKQKGELEIR